MITTLAQFATTITNDKLTSEQIYELVEFGCVENVRTQLLKLADDDSNEPFREAIHNLGFTYY